MSALCAAPFGYRYVTMNFDSNSHVLPDTFDEVSLATTLHVGEWAGGSVSVLFGAGYNPELAREAAADATDYVASVFSRHWKLCRGRRRKAPARRRLGVSWPISTL